MVDFSIERFLPRSGVFGSSTVKEVSGTQPAVPSASRSAAALGPCNLLRSNSFRGVARRPVEPSPPTREPAAPINEVLYVKCLRGHTMEARVVREMWVGFDEVLRPPSPCLLCGCQITPHDARYVCDVCDIVFCTRCSATALGLHVTGSPSLQGKVQQMQPTQPWHGQQSAALLPQWLNGGMQPSRGYSPGMPLHPSGPPPRVATPQRAGSHAFVQYSSLPRVTTPDVRAGDIILCGPDEWGVHHVMLVRETMEPDPRAGQLLGVKGDKDVFACGMIESTRARAGVDVAWHPATTVFTRDRATGASFIVGTMEPGSIVIDELAEPVPVKLLQHPLRFGRGGPAFDAAAFDKAVIKSAVTSQDWGIATAIRAITATQESLKPETYCSLEGRRKLSAELRGSWARPPICTSVAIMVWQYYFIFASGPSQEDLAMQQILRWVPLLADATMPSVLLKVLTRCGWILRGNLDG